MNFTYIFRVMLKLLLKVGLKRSTSNIIHPTILESVTIDHLEGTQWQDLSGDPPHHWIVEREVQEGFFFASS